MMHLTNFNKLELFKQAVLLLGLFYLTSCSGDINDNFDPKQFSSHTEEVSRSYKDCDIADDTCTYIVISTIVFDQLNEFENLQKINDHIDDIMLGRETNDVDSVCADFINGYDRIMNDSLMNIEEYSLAWYDIREAEIVSVKKRVVSIKCSIRSFYGGAHPNEYIYLRNFIPETGDSLGIGMIFNPRALEELRALAEYTFRKKYDLSIDIDYEAEGYWFENNTFELSSNFAFTEHGLLFYYNNYEIAPYSMGSSEIVVPYSIIMHLFE